MTGFPILIPVNGLDRAKGRLAGILNDDERAMLSLITLETVLHAAGQDAIVLTPDERVAEAARPHARILAEDPKAAGLNGQLEAALAALRAESNPDCVLILHADLPLASPAAIGSLGDMSTPGSIVAVESFDGGTNAMLMRPPGKFRLAYGPGSFEKHREAAHDAGMRVHVNENRELRLDLDTPDDLRELLRAPRGRQGAAGRYLLSIGIEERLERA